MTTHHSTNWTARQSTFAPIDAQPGLPGMLRCLNCGATEDVTVSPVYVGGHGYEMRPQCLDGVSCWTRHDVQELFDAQGGMGQS